MRRNLFTLSLLLVAAGAWIALSACQAPTDALVGDRDLGVQGKPDHAGGGNGNGGGDDGGDSGSSGLVVTFSDAGNAITGDGDPYVNGECGVEAAFSLGDVRLKLNELKGKQARTCGDSPVLRFDYDGDGTFEGSGTFMNVADIEGLSTSDPVETTASFSTAECNTLKFNPDPPTCDPSFPSCDEDPVGPGSDHVLAWQNPDGSWTVQTADTDADGTPAEAYCANDGQLYSVPFEVVVSAIQ